MSSPLTIYEACSMYNNVFAAFFLNECDVKEGINFEDSKPQMTQISWLNEERSYFNDYDTPYGLKHFFQGRVEFDNVDIEKLKVSRIEDFFDKTMQSKITDVARYFANAVNAHKYCDFVFSSMPDATPFIYDCMLDPETNFRARLIIGHDLATNTYNAVWEFYCLLMSKFRQVDDHPTYGLSFKDVDYMTDEEREKFNKQLESE